VLPRGSHGVHTLYISHGHTQWLNQHPDMYRGDWLRDPNGAKRKNSPEAKSAISALGDAWRAPYAAQHTWLRTLHPRHSGHPS